MKTVKQIDEMITTLKRLWYSVDNYTEAIEIEARMSMLYWVLDKTEEYDAFMKESVGDE